MSHSSKSLCQVSFSSKQNKANGKREIDAARTFAEMSNETAKAELGRAGWRLLHTMGQRYPDKPTPDEQQAFTDFLHLFGRMYPCGECAQHFTEMLQEFPVQSSSKTTGKLFGLEMHTHAQWKPTPSISVSLHAP